MNDEAKQEWPEQRDAFINALVGLFYKHFPEKLTECPDCGGFQMHVCEKAFRQFQAMFFDKVYEHGQKHPPGG